MNSSIRFSRFLLAVLMTSSGFNTGCLQTRSDIAEQEEKHKIHSTVSTLQKSKADVEARFDDINSDLRQMNGKIESTEHKNAGAFDSLRSESNSQKKKLEEVLSQMKIFDETILKAHQRIDILEKEVASLRSAKESASEKPEKRDYFKDAEEYFSSKDWKKAISFYQKFREQNPKSKEFVLATFKIGVCFKELGMKAEARAFFEEVIEKFPKDKLAKSSLSHLKQMKK